VSGLRAPAIAAALLLCLAAAARGEATSDVLRAPRPPGGEYFGLYLVDKKIGWYFTDLQPVPGRAEVRSVADFVFKAVVGNNTAERRHAEERIYESRPGGRLLSFVVKDEGDGGNQLLTGKATSTGFSVKRHRPGQADETFNLPAVQETVEDADQLRVALLRAKEVSGMTLDGTDLSQYRMTTTPGPEERRAVNGVSILLRKATIVSEKEKVPMQAVVAPDGAVVEMSYGSAMIARAEPKSVAERLDRERAGTGQHPVGPGSQGRRVEENAPVSHSLILGGAQPWRTRARRWWGRSGRTRRLCTTPSPSS